MGNDYQNHRGPRRDFQGNRGQGNYRGGDRRGPGDFAPRVFDRERVPDEIIGPPRELVTERKKLTFTRRKNAAGEFLRIDEENQRTGRRSVVIIPAEHVDEALGHLDELFPPPA